MKLFSGSQEERLYVGLEMMLPTEDLEEHHLLIMTCG